MLSPNRFDTFWRRASLQNFLILLLVAVAPLLVAIFAMDLWSWDFSIPLDYRENNSDETWQLILTKMVTDGCWILDNKFLGAPDIAHWHNNSAAQTSLLHSVVMYGISKIISNAIAVQLMYYLLCFSLISISTYISCRLLNISRMPAFLVSLMCSLLSYRFNYIAYSFLPNYYLVPLSLVSIFWVISGEFSFNFFENRKFNLEILLTMFRSSKFSLGLLFIFLISISDGYYAFFTLLLLGFSVFVRLLVGDWRKPLCLIVPVVYIVTLLATAVIISLPISIYKSNHYDEFYPGGVQDPALVRHAFEAEIYSLSLKMLIAPSIKHRVDRLSELGKTMIETNDVVRLYKTQIVYVPLGILGAGLLFFSVAYILVPTFPWRSVSNTFQIGNLRTEPGYIWIASVLSLCILFISTPGGVGSLIALFFPTIRAYDRFPLFMIFSLYIGFGCIATYWMKNSKEKLHTIVVFGIVLTATLSIYDQLPNDVAKGSLDIKRRFLAERKFVGNIERLLPKGAMVYQYPYSQWLTDSPYYGWGSFAHTRLYLHSIALRWSNGASKNSPVDNWHTKLAELPIEQLVNEVAEAGFSAVVVDKHVVSNIEYQRVKDALINQVDAEIIDDKESELVFFKLKRPSFHVTYDSSYQSATKIEIYNLPLFLLEENSQMVNVSKVKEVLGVGHHTIPIIYENSNHPDIFFTKSEIARNEGSRRFDSLSEIKGSIECDGLAVNTLSLSKSSFVTLSLANRGDFDWTFNKGRYPLNIGLHVRNMKGEMISWDDGIRLPFQVESIPVGKKISIRPFVLKRSSSVQITYSPSQLNLKRLLGANKEVLVEIRLVQDGNAWFDKVGCDLHVTR